MKEIKSRVGSNPIKYGSLKVKNDNNNVQISNGKSTLELAISKDFLIEDSNGILSLKPNVELNKKIKALWGTYNRLLQNFIKGLMTPYVKELSLVGYRVQYSGNKLVFKIGYSHDVEIIVPSDITVTVKGTNITLSCCDKEKLGGFVKHITDQRKYNPYSGNGIIERGKQYIKKAVKKK